MTRLREAGFATVRADALDRASLDRAFAGADAVFGVTNPFVGARWTGASSAAPATDTDGEVTQGKNIADACKACGAFLVFTSVASALDKTGVPTFDAKAAVEDHIRAIGLPCAIIAPVGFFENMRSPFAGIKQGVIPGLLKKGRKAQMIACDDIGYFAARAIAGGPGAFAGTRLEIAGDELSADEQCAVLARLRGEEGKWKTSTPPDFVFKLFIPKAVGSLKTFLDERGCRVDIAALRAAHPELKSFEAWCVAEGLDKAVLAKPSLCAIT